MKHIKKMSFVAILIASIILGILAGSGIAFAHDGDHTLRWGLNLITGLHANPNYEYYYRYEADRNSTGTQVDVDYTRYTPKALDQYGATYSSLWIYDEDGDDYFMFINFLWVSMEYTVSAYTQCTLDELDTTNNYVWFTQAVDYRITTFDDNAKCWTGIGTPDL